jgi:hypothetical protein
MAFHSCDGIVGLAGHDAGPAVATGSGAGPGSMSKAVSGEVNPIHRRKCVTRKEESRFHVNKNGSIAPDP